MYDISLLTPIGSALTPPFISSAPASPPWTEQANPHQQNSHRNNKNNNYMLDISNKENVWLERQEPRQVSFHFCQRYAKKGDRRTKTEAPESQPRMIRGSKIVLVPKGKNGGEQGKTEQSHHHKLSNFQILKRKISYLETEQFLGDKSQRPEQRQCDRGAGVDYVVNGEFGHSKRISVLEKYRQNIKNIKREGQKRKSSLNLIIRSQLGDSCSKLALQLPAPHPDPQSSEWLVKKREVVTQCAKRYFRPQSFNRSRQGRLIQSVAQVKGRRMQTVRAHKSTINFY